LTPEAKTGDDISPDDFLWAAETAGAGSVYLVFQSRLAPNFMLIILKLKAKFLTYSEFFRLICQQKFSLFV